MIRSLRERCPPSVLSSRMWRSSSSVWVSSSALARPRPRTRRVRLLAVLSSQITGQKTWAIKTSGGRRDQRQDPRRADGQRLGGLLAQRHVQEGHQAERRHRHDADREPGDQPLEVEPDAAESPREERAPASPDVADHRQLRQGHEKTGNQRLDPVLDRPAQRQAGDRDPDLRRREVDVQLVQGLAGHPGRPAPLLHQLVDLAGADLDQRELGGDEIGVDQDQSGDDQEVCIFHRGTWSRPPEGAFPRIPDPCVREPGGERVSMNTRLLEGERMPVSDSNRFQADSHCSLVGNAARGTPPSATPCFPHRLSVFRLDLRESVLYDAKRSGRTTESGRVQWYRRGRLHGTPRGVDSDHRDPAPDGADRGVPGISGGPGGVLGGGGARRRRPRRR